MFAMAANTESSVMPRFFMRVGEGLDLAAQRFLRQRDGDEILREFLARHVRAVARDVERGGNDVALLIGEPAVLLLLLSPAAAAATA